VRPKYYYFDTYYFHSISYKSIHDKTTFF
jgi:hypothetical protein